MLIILRLLSLLLAAFQLRSNLALENLALRQQLAILKRRHPRPRLRRSDRVFWLLLSRAWSHWRDTLVIVKPETVIRWHRNGFASYWTRLSRRSRTGRPRKDREIRELIQRIANANILWGAPRVHGELLKLGINISERTVSRWMPRRRKPPSQTWRTFLDNRVGELVSIDFFTVVVRNTPKQPRNSVKSPNFRRILSFDLASMGLDRVFAKHALAHNRKRRIFVDVGEN